MEHINFENVNCKLGDAVFRGCTNLRKIGLPQNLTNVKTECFFDCCRITSLTLPKTVKKIDKHAFSYMPELTDIWIPNDVMAITQEQFFYSKKVRVHYKGHIYTYADLDTYKIFS